MHWELIHTMDDLDSIIERSRKAPQLILKHSTSCSISHVAKLRLESDIDKLNSPVNFHYLDLLSYRSISNKIAERLEVHHESPQIILLLNGEVIHDASHFDISIEEINEVLDYHLEKS